MKLASCCPGVIGFCLGVLLTLTVGGGFVLVSWTYQARRAREAEMVAREAMMMAEQARHEALQNERRARMAVEAERAAREVRDGNPNQADQALMPPARP